MPATTPTSYETAKDVVLEISKTFGYLAEEELDELRPDLRRRIEDVLLAKDKIAGHAIITLAQNIYGSGARFVFEVLQNADDNHFTKADASGVPPCVSFHVYTDRIVVECNEDGFTKENLQAICSVGGSSKSGSHGYIGAKGIGFKSVFIVAWKVQIQSGYFSFHFKHRKGDSGLGMVVPIWTEPKEILQGPLTRMTLYLHDKKDEAHLHKTIFKQLSDLQEASLLFLRKLKKINVHFYDDDDALERSRSFHSMKTDDHIVRLETIETQTEGNRNTCQKQYHVTSHMACNLSMSVSRQIPDTETARTAAAVAEVVLAFPLEPNSDPIVKNQELFAFLPIRQSDFKLTKNIDLLDAIAGAFIKAVLEFCENPRLCYTWPSFLPSLKLESTPFWSELKQNIRRRVSETPIMMPRRRKQLQKVDAVMTVAADFMDDGGKPLLDDNIMDAFLCEKYPQEAVSILKEYGLRNMNGGDLARLLRADLEQANSRMKSVSTCQRWHSIMAQLLAKGVKREQLRELPLLPLRDGKWVSPDSDPVYLPTTAGISVPLGLDIRILDPAAVANDDRRKLFAQYGATEPSVAYVRKSIRSVYNAFDWTTVYVSKAHLRFLYLSQLCPPTPIRDEYRAIRVHTREGHTEIPYTQDVFLSTNHPYGAKELMQPHEGAPGFPVAYIHPEYLLQSPVTPSEQHQSWTRWLCEFIGVRERLRLIAQNGTELSDTWSYVAVHRPDKLLGLLEHLWRHEGLQITSNNSLEMELQRMSANRLCKSPLSGPCLLKDTFLPLEPLKRHCDRFMEETEPFPFLKLDSTMNSEQLRAKWLFLHQNFSVGIDDDLPFLLDVLFWITKANKDASEVVRPQRLVDLYIAIDGKCAASADQESHRQAIANVFDETKCLYVPPSDIELACWADPSICVWDGPPNLHTKHSLKQLFAKELGTNQMDRVSRFFRYVLRVPDVSWEDIVAELEFMKEDHCQDFDQISMLYQRIATDADANDATQRLVRQYFALNNHIYVVKDGTAGWFKSSECLWSSTTDIRGKVTLNDHYEDLKDFFIDTLDVKTLTLQMVYDELLQTSSGSSIDEVKSAIWSLNSPLQSEAGALDPEPLLERKIFAITNPNGSKVRVSTDVEFSIGDREYLTAHFRGRIKLLDYDLAEVRQLKTFLEWTKLTNRYLSESVREMTSVNDDEVCTVSSASRDIKRKAHALLRIAATFNSPRYAANGPGLYETLRTIETRTTDKISSVLKLSQNGGSVDVESSSGDMHIGEVDGGVTVYVPRNKRKQKFCFASPLPTNLAAWLMRDPVTQIQDRVDGAMVTALTTLLAVAPSAVNLILDHKGIIEVPIVNEDLESYDDDSSLDSEDDENGNDNAVVRYTPPEGGESAAIDYEILEVVSAQARSGYGGGRGYRSYRLSSYQAHSDDDDDNQYRELLNKVVRAARAAWFPSKGTFDMSALQSALSVDATVSYNGFELGSRYHSNNQFERNFKIGAAGELYVFELLSRLQPALHGWGRENWQSNIRGRVSLHEDYAGMRGWGGGPETADLVYDDTYGNLTELLIDHGYLDDGWKEANPRYYIEVKTTTGPCGTPFYMSKNQYQRMQNIHNAERQREVYMVLRVFEIENEGRIGMKVYVDPVQLEIDDQLVFTGESWSVTPATP